MLGHSVEKGDVAVQVQKSKKSKIGCAYFIL